MPWIKEEPPVAKASHKIKPDSSTNGAFSRFPLVFLLPTWPMNDYQLKRPTVLSQVLGLKDHSASGNKVEQA